MKKEKITRGLHYGPYIDGEILNEMALVGYMQHDSKGRDYAISVDSGTNRIGNPYFKVYDGSSRGKQVPVARISFYEPEYIIHDKDNVKNQFKLSSDLRKTLVNFLKSTYDVISGKRITNWQYAIVQYNLENIKISGWKINDWLYFTQKWKRDNANEIAGTQAEHALPIDLPMPNYLNLR